VSLNHDLEEGGSAEVHSKVLVCGGWGGGGGGGIKLPGLERKKQKMTYLVRARFPS